MTVGITNINPTREGKNLIKPITMGEKKTTERVVTELSQKCMRPRCFHRLILSILQKTDDTNAILTIQSLKREEKSLNSFLKVVKTCYQNLIKIFFKKP